MVARFWLVFAVLFVATAVCGIVAFAGMHDLRAAADRLERSAGETAVHKSIDARVLELRSAVQLHVTADDLTLQRRFQDQADDAIVELTLLLRRGVRDPHEGDQQLAKAADARLTAFVAAWRSGELAVPEHVGDDAAEARVVARTERLLEPLRAVSSTLAEHDAEQTAESAAHAGAAYEATRTRIAVVFGVTLLLGSAMMLWLIRTVVPRLRRYARFAARVTAGEIGSRLEFDGDDELGALGESLNGLVVRHEVERDHQRSQTEFAAAMQVTESESEAQALIKRHLERATAGTVVVLNRNNSDDRLEAVTPVPEGSHLEEGLDGASPRSCLAVRLGRRHESGAGLDPLLSCEVCGKRPELATCEPLTVGGEVIGSVLVAHAEPLGASGDHLLRDTLGQAAPVLANLRNLAIAELRAATDVLTGLPNNRAVRDTLKRMVAHANRTGTSLVAGLLDLDHFKQVNDTYGHGRGDEVLAAVGEVLRSSLRESDFAGRFGGEEFLVLLPDTDLAGGFEVAESMRQAIAQIQLPGFERQITASFGLAVVPEDGTDADTLARNADRALYSAKSRGRNRTEAAGAAPTPAL